MGEFFVAIYEYFQRRRLLLILSLISVVAAMALFAYRIKFEENITKIFPDTGGSVKIAEVFDNIKYNDRIIFIFSSEDAPELRADAAEGLRQRLLSGDGGLYVEDIVLKIDEGAQSGMMEMIYDNLPLLLTDEDYRRIDSLFIDGQVDLNMERNRINLLTPSGIALKQHILRDPFGIGNEALKSLSSLQPEGTGRMEDGYLFSEDGRYLMMFLTPKYGIGNTGENDKLISIIERELNFVREGFPEVESEYFGGPSVGVYNARQIKRDTFTTLSIALIVIIAFMLAVFRRKRSVFMILAPVVFGGLFAIFMISIIKGAVSIIAVGAGSAILGIALSYSIHMLAHQAHVKSVQQLIREIVKPLTIGSFTTICAFLGLLFTSSDLLRDFGLFAAMSLIGTTFFSLIYLPHFLSGGNEWRKSSVLKVIEKFNSYAFDRNVWIVSAVILLVTIGVFASDMVKFDSDVSSLSFEPKHIKDAEEKLSSSVGSERKMVLFISAGDTPDKAADLYRRVNGRLDTMVNSARINSYASVGDFVMSSNEKTAKLNRWKIYWSEEKRDRIKKLLNDSAAKYNFREGTFAPFLEWFDRDYSILSSEVYGATPILSDWINIKPELTMVISQVNLSNENRDAVYAAFEDEPGLIIYDRAFFVKEWVSAINDDFYLVLYISSILVFIALLISYGRIELTIISFLPMFLSWIIILGIMGLLGIEFNIVNIILSAFIFGIGDDFSIFVMDGLQSKYRTGKELLDSHKTAIFFSAFTIAVGMGSMLFAKHPALQSISTMSLLGILVVVLVSYTVQPALFRWFISNPVSKGEPPYTLYSAVLSVLLYTAFVIGSFIICIISLLLYPLPVYKKYKQRVISIMMINMCRILFKVVPNVRVKRIDIERSKSPTVIIANHQSFIDTLFILSCSLKIVMVTNKWVWRSPIFGIMVRFAGYVCVDDGYGKNISKLREMMEQGYSIVVFPEGTRSVDGRIGRFHKGAFSIAEDLGLSITPLLLYGTGMVVSKSYPFNIQSGIVGIKMLPAIAADDPSFGVGYRERSKSISKYFRAEHALLTEQFANSSNPYFFHRLTKNYIYKGPVLEWYVKVKVRMERSYRWFDSAIPDDAVVTDVGCGYGMLPNMLHLYSGLRRITGIDYDTDKIDAARHGFLTNDSVDFIASDVLAVELPVSDVFVLNDILHYMSRDKQERLLRKCFAKLNNNGIVIVRDGDKSDIKRQKITSFTELLSTKIFKFNQTKEELTFTSKEQLLEIGGSCGMSAESLQNDKYTSNIILVFRKTH